MENYINKITDYLPKIEEFLTSVLLEETKVTITDQSTINTAENYGQLPKEDIYLLAQDSVSELDIVATLDKEWFGLLSSIMLGVEEKGFNDATNDLLKKFASELLTNFKRFLSEDGQEIDIDQIQVLEQSAMEGLLKHSSYFVAMLEVEGLADENVHATIMIGDPEARLVVEASEPELEEESEDGFKEAKGEDLHVEDEVLTGHYIEFEDFGDDEGINLVSDDGNNMDMLRDVDMDVSVELGRIQLPLGRVLQLAKGSVIELDKLAGEPVDILVNGQRIAQGEVVVIDEHFGVRISNLITTRQHLVKMN